MTNILDYIKWRGDLTFRQDPFNAVDALILSSLVYIRFEDITRPDSRKDIDLYTAAEAFLKLDKPEEHARMPQDVQLLRLAADSARFSSIRIVGYGSTFAPDEDTQFAAISFELGDGTLCAAFRGTDNTMVGWKEDFNMTYLESVPAQRLAMGYVMDLHHNFHGGIRLCGHSKGGNLAVYAASMCAPQVQSTILEVYNFDGPGFTEHMLQEDGYRTVVPKIHSYVPQSSIIGMMLEHGEAFTVIHSDGIGVFQHDNYTWEVMGKELVPMEHVTPDSVFVNATLKEWLAEMTPEEREQFVDSLFSLAGTGSVREAFSGNNLWNAIRMLNTDNQMRDVLTREFSKLFDSFRRVIKEGSLTDSDELEVINS